VRTLYVLFSLARRERGGANLLLSRGLGPEGVFSWSKASARLMDPLWKWSLKSGDCGLLVMRGFLKTYPEPAGPGLFADLASDCATYRAAKNRLPKRIIWELFPVFPGTSTEGAILDR
jgi:hypothetical protein